MKKILLTITSFILVTLSTFSQDSGFGIGIILGEPTGISAKLWINSTNAFDAGAAWSFITNKDEEASQLRLAFHTDYLYHFLNIYSIPSGNLAFYCGAGASIKILDNGIILGIRIPLGIDYLFKSFPVDIFLELVPIMEIFPETRPNGNGGLGVRYFF